MALDMGEKRIGVALTDPEGRLAYPERVLHRRSLKADRQLVAALVAELGVDRVILGLPLSMEGDVGPNAQRTQAFGAYLSRVLPVPVDYQDERLSTVEAEERLLAAGVRRDVIRERIDAAAAAVILEDYMRVHAS